MTRNKLILSIAAMSCLLPSSRVHSQQPGGNAEVRARETRFQLDDSEMNVNMHELELKMSELAVDEAMVELDKIKLHLEAAIEQRDSREAGRARLDLKQAAIRVEMRKVQSEMAHIQVKRAKAGLAHVRAVLTEKPEKPARVQLEYVDDLDVVVIRGAKGNVEKIKALIEGAKTKDGKP